MNKKKCVKKIKVFASNQLGMNEEQLKYYELAEKYAKKYKKAMEVLSKW